MVDDDLVLMQEIRQLGPGMLTADREDDQPAATKRGTLLRMEQSGFRCDQEANYRGAKHGWQKFIGGLERVVAGLQ